MKVKEEGHIRVGRGTTVGELMLTLQNIPQDALFEYEETLYCYRWREATLKESRERVEVHKQSLAEAIESHERLAAKAREKLDGMIASQELANV